jgi:hypothetical protein
VDYQTVYLLYRTRTVLYCTCLPVIRHVHPPLLCGQSRIHNTNSGNVFGIHVRTVQEVRFVTASWLALFARQTGTTIGCCTVQYCTNFGAVQYCDSMVISITVCGQKDMTSETTVML